MRHFEPGGHLGPGGGTHGGPHEGWELFGGIIWLLLIAAVVVVAVVVANKVVNRSQPVVAPAAGPGDVAPDRADEALTILRARYARGEVGRDDYLQAAADLGAPPEPPASR